MDETMQNKYDFEKMDAIIKKLGNDELLGQATEECCELGQALQKVWRALKGTTPVSIETAISNLNEEAADVLLLIDCLRKAGLLNIDTVEDTIEYKINRWFERVTKKLEGE